MLSLILGVAPLLLKLLPSFGLPMFDRFLSSKKDIATSKATVQIEQVKADIAKRVSENELLAVEARERTKRQKDDAAHWSTRWIRPAFAYPIAFYFAWIFIVNKVMGIGATDPLGPQLWNYAMVVAGTYMGGRSLEKIAGKLGRK